MGDEFDDLVSQVLGTSKTPAQAPAPPAAQPQPAAATPPAPAAAPPAPAQAVPPGEQPTAPAAQPTPPQAGNQPSDPADAVLQELETKEQELFQKILPAFALTPELVAEMETDAVNAVPKVLAKTFMHSVSTSLRYMKQIVPAMIEREMARMKTADTVEKAFFGKFPKLNAKDHGNDVIAFANTFRQQNPQMAQDELFARVGAAVMAMRGIAHDAAPAAQPGVVSVVPVAPGAPPAPTPFAPAATGGSVVATQPIARQGWEGLGGDYD